MGAASHHCFMANAEPQRRHRLSKQELVTDALMILVDCVSPELSRSKTGRRAEASMQHDAEPVVAKRGRV